MRAEKVIAALLGAAGDVTSIVGQRIYGGVAEEDAPAPLIVYRKAPGTQRDETLLSAGEPVIVTALVEVTYVATSYEQLKTLAEAGRVALINQQGITAGIQVHELLVADEGADEYDHDIKEHGQRWTYRVVHTE